MPWSLTTTPVSADSVDNIAAAVDDALTTVTSDQDPAGQAVAARDLIVAEAGRLVGQVNGIAVGASGYITDSVVSLSIKAEQAQILPEAVAQQTRAQVQESQNPDGSPKAPGDPAPDPVEVARPMTEDPTAAASDDKPEEGAAVPRESADSDEARDAAAQADTSGAAAPGGGGGTSSGASGAKSTGKAGTTDV